MAALRAATCNALGGWWKHNVGIQVLWDLTTVVRQPGETAASALKPSHMYKTSKYASNFKFPIITH